MESEVRDDFNCINKFPFSDVFSETRESNFQFSSFSFCEKTWLPINIGTIPQINKNIMEVCICIMDYIQHLI